MNVTWTQGERFSFAQCNNCRTFWLSLHRKKSALRANRPVFLQHRHDHESEGSAVTVRVMTGYRGCGAIFPLFLTMTLYGVSSTLVNYWISVEWPQGGGVLAFQEIWNAVQPTVQSSVNPDCLTLVHRLSWNCRRRYCAKRVVKFRYCPDLYHMLNRKLLLIRI